MFGLSGVGKTSLIRNAVSGLDGVLHLQASALIKQGFSDVSISSEALRQSSGDRVLANQRVLLSMFDRAVAGSCAGLVVFDGHLIIDADAEIVEIPREVIAAMRPASLVHVEAAPDTIAERRRQDAARARPERTAAVLAEQQHRSRDRCQRFAASLGIVAHVIQDGSPETLRGIWGRASQASAIGSALPDPDNSASKM